MRFDEDRMYEMAVEGHKAGFRIGTHAIGDVAIDTVLNVYKRLYDETPSPQRHRVEHLGLPNRAHFDLMAKYNMVSVPQTIFIKELGPNFRKYLDDQYLELTYPVRSVLDKGIDLALSSDAPVVKSFNPMTGLMAAVNRKDREGVTISLSEAITEEEALYAYTMGGAIVNGDEDNRGSIAKGKWADLVILASNPLKVETEEIENVKVDSTFVGGKLVYKQA